MNVNNVFGRIFVHRSWIHPVPDAARTTKKTFHIDLAARGPPSPVAKQFTGMGCCLSAAAKQQAAQAKPKVIWHHGHLVTEAQKRRIEEAQALVHRHRASVSALRQSINEQDSKIRSFVSRLVSTRRTRKIDTSYRP